jgi:hypothetical protein
VGPEIKNCFKFKCPKDWEKLDQTDDLGIRYCSSCQKNVYFSKDEAMALDYAKQGKCVAIRVYEPEIESDMMLLVS